MNTTTITSRHLDIDFDAKQFVLRGRTTAATHTALGPIDSFALHLLEPVSELGWLVTDINEQEEAEQPLSVIGFITCSSGTVLFIDDAYLHFDGASEIAVKVKVASSSSDGAWGAEWLALGTMPAAVPDAVVHAVRHMGGDITSADVLDVSIAGVCSCSNGPSRGRTACEEEPACPALERYTARWA